MMSQQLMKQQLMMSLHSYDVATGHDVTLANYTAALYTAAHCFTAAYTTVAHDVTTAHDRAAHDVTVNHDVTAAHDTAAHVKAAPDIPLMI